MNMSVCLSVCHVSVCPHAYLGNRALDLRQISYTARGRRDPHPAQLRLVVYFRFVDDVICRQSAIQRQRQQRVCSERTRHNEQLGFDNAVYSLLLSRWQHKTGAESAIYDCLVVVDVDGRLANQCSKI